MTFLLKFSIVCAVAVISVKRIGSQTVSLTATPAQVKPSDRLSLRCRLIENISITGVRFYRNDVWRLFITNPSSSCDYTPIGDDGNNYTYSCDPTDRWYQMTLDSVRETEHGVIWRCSMDSSTTGPGLCGTNNGVNPCTSQDVTVTVIGEVKNVEITSENGTTISSPVVISESNTNTKLVCTTGPSGSRPKAQLTWWRTGTWDQQISSGVKALPGQSLDLGYVVSKSTLNVANISYNGVSIFCRALLATEQTNSGQVTLDVRFKPDIDIRVAGATYTTYIITENQQNVQFTCNIISANPNTGITYSWLRDGQTIPGVTGHTYSITRVQRANRGILTCTAINTEGTTTSSGVNIDVQYQAVITAMQDVALEEGTPLTQVCTADGNPPPSFRWTFGGKEVSSSATLRSNSITSQQNGTYTCHVNNTLTPTGDTAMSRETLATLHVTVYFGPKNVVPSQTHVNITAGQSDSSVSCTATCNPACTYRWLKDGSQVNPGSTLQLMSVSKSQAGNYYCEASNTFLNKIKTRGSTLAVIVNVMFSPEVQLKPKQNIQPTPDPYSIFLGQTNVGLRCSVVDSKPPPSSYTWSVNNSIIEGAVQETYTIINVTLKTAGTYRCRGNNGIGDPAYSSLNLDVQYEPVIGPIINQTKAEGTSLSVSCQYTSNPPNGQVRWTKVNNNNNNNNNNNIFNQTQNSLSISSLHRSDSGMYRCSVTNTLHLSGNTNEQLRTATRDFYLDVQYQPFITSLYVEGNITVVSEHDTVKIVCETDSNPASTFTWTRQSDIASLPERGNMLTLSSVQCSDTTFFTCTANNYIGSAATKNVQLFVQCQPRIDSMAPQGTAYGAVGESINITVQHIIAFPPPTFMWEKVNSDTLPPSNQTDTNTSSTLTVRRLDVDDFGNYSVTIDNNIVQPFVFYIEVESASHPLKPTNVTVITSTTNSVTLSWTPGFDGGAAQTFSIQYRRDGGSDFSNYSKTFLDENSQPMTAAVDGLEEGTVYYFRVIAINQFGESPVTEEIRAVTTDKLRPVSSNLGGIIGGAAGGGLAIVLIAGIAVFLIRRNRNNKGTRKQTTADEDRDQLEFEDVNTPNSLYQSAGPSNETYAQVDLKKKKKKTMDVQPEGDLYAVVNKSKPKNSGADTTVYENPGLLINEIPKTENDVYANQPVVPKRRNQDGLIYIDLDLGPKKNVKGKAVIHGIDDATEYAEVAFGKKGPPPPDLDD